MAVKMKATVPWLVRLVCLVPFSLLLFGIYRNSLGPDPADALATATGEWALRFLLLSLSITPIRKVFGWSDIAPLRRTLGLFALFYATAHFWFI
jgi:sulfoxide reductase heme-binding subunit YedZ